MSSSHLFTKKLFQQYSKVWKYSGNIIFAKHYGSGAQNLKCSAEDPILNKHEQIRNLISGGLYGISFDLKTNI